MDTVYSIQGYSVLHRIQGYINHGYSIPYTGYRVILVINTVYSKQGYSCLYRIQGYISHGYSIFYTRIQRSVQDTGLY